LSAEDAAHFGELLRSPQPSTYAPGQIWSTTATVEAHQDPAASVPLPGHLVVVLGVDTEPTGGLSVVTTAPISLETAYQGSFDLKVKAAESPLGYDFMVELWNELQLETEQLQWCLGALEQTVQSYVARLYQAFLGESIDLSSLEDRIGPAILAPNDPRALFQEREIESCDPLRRPVLARGQQLADEVVVETLGELVALHSEQFHAVLPAANVAALQADPTPVTELSGGTNNPALAAALNRAEIPGPQRRTVWAILWESLSELVCEQQPGQRPVYARRQRGKGGR
jgi:hypothetical protein